jgi:ribosome biogenesis GTPase A
MLRNEFQRKNGDQHVVIKLIDIFDFHGTWVHDLREVINRRNPVILAVNKVDLLPPDAKLPRIRDWALTQSRALGLDVVDVFLVSGAMGTNLKALVTRAATLAARYEDARIYLMGAANVGKSTLVNYMIKQGVLLTTGKGQKPIFDPVTVSPRPGTTLGLNPFAVLPTLLPRASTSVIFYDSPGIMDPSHLWSRLRIDELRSILPVARVKPVSYRLSVGQSVLLGAMVRFDMTDGRPFFLTVFVSPNVTVHVTDTLKTEALLQKHAGGLFTPPFTPDRHEVFRLQSTPKTFALQGAGWMQSAQDIVIPGLGWVSVTGCGPVSFDVYTPVGLTPTIRPPLLPFETRRSTKRFHGPNKNRR